MLKIISTPELVALANKRARDISADRKTVVEDRDRWAAGHLGEEQFSRHYGLKTGFGQYNENFDAVRESDGATFEIKSPSIGERIPTRAWRVQVPKNADNKSPDFFGFAFAARDLSAVWLIGYIRADVWRVEASFVPAGEQYPNRNGIIAKADCFVMTVRDVQRFGVAAYD